MNLTTHVKNFIKEHRLIQKGDLVLIGVSGGADSVTLVHVLNQLKFDLGCDLHLAHFNHNLRKGSSSDQRFVQQLAQNLSLPVTCGLWRNPSKQKKGSLEERARKQRLSFLTKTATKLGAQRIALGHSENDLAETMLMRMIRGAGLQGMRGILPFSEMQGYCFIRPLLETKRRDIEKFLNKHHLEYREDETNRQRTFLRNRVRLDLLPLLEKSYNANISERLAETSEHMSMDFDFLEQQAHHQFDRLGRYSPQKNTVTFPLKAYQRIHPSMQQMLIRLAFEKLHGNRNRLTSRQLGSVRQLLSNPKNGHSQVPLAKNTTVSRSRESLLIKKN